MGIVFTPTETQTAISDTVNGLLAGHYDFAARQKIVKTGTGHSPAFWSKLAELGLLGIEAPESEGGIGGSFAETAVVLQAFGGALVLEPFIPTAVLGLGLINELASPSQRLDLLPPVIAGTMKLALAHNEAAGSAIETTATKTANGWRLQGSKSLVLGGNTADMFLVSATDNAATRLFLVPADTAGLSRVGYTLYDENGAADLVIDVILPQNTVLGDAAGSRPAIERALDRGTAAVIHEAIGAMDKLCSMTPEYLKTRVQFGQPLARFQVLQHKMVEMGMALEQARSMAMLATSALDEADPVVRARNISAAKLFVGDAARLVGQAAVQLHGGIALTDEYPAGHYFKRLTLIARQFGDELYHLDRYAEMAA